MTSFDLMPAGSCALRDKTRRRDDEFVSSRKSRSTARGGETEDRESRVRSRGDVERGEGVLRTNASILLGIATRSAAERTCTVRYAPGFFNELSLSLDYRTRGFDVVIGSNESIDYTDELMTAPSFIGNRRQARSRCIVPRRTVSRPLSASSLGSHRAVPTLNAPSSHVHLGANASKL